MFCIFTHPNPAHTVYKRLKHLLSVYHCVLVFCYIIYAAHFTVRISMLLNAYFSVNHLCQCQATCSTTTHHLLQSSTKHTHKPYTHTNKTQLSRLLTPDTHQQPAYIPDCFKHTLQSIVPVYFSVTYLPSLCCLTAFIVYRPVLFFEFTILDYR